MLTSMMFPLICFVSAWGFIQLYEPANLSGDSKFITKELAVTASDGITLRGIYFSLPNTKAPPRILFIGNPHLDKDWNSNSLDFHSGRWLASSLSSFGIETLRYDPRGIGKSKASRRTHGNFSLQIADVKSLYKIIQKFKASRLYLLAHGDHSCHLALHTASHLKLSVDGFILLNCGGTGNLLDLWGKQLFANMERKGSQVSIIAQAKTQWQQWLTSGKIPAPSQKNGDLVAFQNALSFLHSPAQASFRKLAPKLYLFELIREQLKQGRHILHLSARFDEERNKAMRLETSILAKRIKKIPYLNQRYSFQILNNADHFLKTQTKVTQGLQRAVSHMNPFRKLDSEAIVLIKKAILTNLK